VFAVAIALQLTAKSMHKATPSQGFAALLAKAGIHSSSDAGAGSPMLMANMISLLKQHQLKRPGGGGGGGGGGSAGADVSSVLHQWIGSQKENLPAKVTACLSHPLHQTTQSAGSFVLTLSPCLSNSYDCRFRGGCCRTDPTFLDSLTI
jgi:hypothetical protein